MIITVNKYGLLLVNDEPKRYNGLETKPTPVLTDIKSWYKNFVVLPVYALQDLGFDYKHICNSSLVKYVLPSNRRNMGREDITFPGWYMAMFDHVGDAYFTKISYCPYCGTNLDVLDDGWIIIDLRETGGLGRFSVYLDRKCMGSPFLGTHIFPSKKEAEDKLECIKHDGIEELC